MFLRRIKYSEFQNTSKQWILEDISFDKINLIVGKNSSGKTRTLNIISSLAGLLSGRRLANFESGSWNATFERPRGQKTETQEYSISFHRGIVKEERLAIDGNLVLVRNEVGEGYVAKKKYHDRVRYKVPNQHLMAVMRRDEFQHPQLQSLYDWGSKVCLYRFGTELGKGNLSMPFQAPFSGGAAELDMSNNTENTTQVFQQTLERFSNQYKELILSDLNEIGYPSEDIMLINAPNIFVNGAAPCVIALKEKQLQCPTIQTEMSQGMFRALAIFIQFNANILWTQSRMVGRTPAQGDSPMIIIDDIGEGLDYIRSKKIIKLLMNKATDANTQLIMSSNDRFVMNDVPLEHWKVLHRDGHKVKAFDSSNSNEKFEEFEYLGLNNFDFFAGNHYLPEVTA